MTTAAPPECAYLPPDPIGEFTPDPDAEFTQTDDTAAWIETHGCHAAATWAILTPGARPADATYACAAHLAELCEDGDTVRRVVDGEAGR
jgi:hypothetical protein